ncbi:hypothetical protein AMECASPLE_028878, partial [Ameca splendens]
CLLNHIAVFALEKYSRLRKHKRKTRGGTTKERGEGRKGIAVAAGALCSLDLLRAPEQSSSVAAGLPLQFRENPHTEILTAQGKRPKRFSNRRQHKEAEKDSASIDPPDDVTSQNCVTQVLLAPRLTYHTTEVIFVFFR